MARLFSARNLILAGLAVGAAYAAKQRQAASGLLGGGSSVGEPAPSPATAPVGTVAAEPGPAAAPAVANADVAGPPENTATHVPAPDPQVHEPEGGIDEEAEEAAAAAEAANIGGAPEDYPSEEDPTVPADDATRPLEEAGEGYSEGQELAEADLLDNAEVAGGDPVEAERQLDEVIEAQDDLTVGEAGEALEQMDLSDEAETEAGPDQPTEIMDVTPPPPTGDPVTDVPPPPETPAEEKGSAVWRIEEPADGGDFQTYAGPSLSEAAADDDEPGPSKTQDGA